LGSRIQVLLLKVTHLNSTTKRIIAVLGVTLFAFLLANLLSYFVCSDSSSVSDGYRCYGFPFTVWKEGGIEGSTYFSQAALWADIAVAFFSFALALLLRLRLFSWPSTIVIVVLALCALFLNSRFRGAWFDGGYGFPLLWYRQTDIDSPNTGFRLGGLIADILVLVIVFRAAAYLFKPNRNRPPASSATPVSPM
jgi:hypothetical protein